MDSRRLVAVLVLSGSSLLVLNAAPPQAGVPAARTVRGGLDMPVDEVSPGMVGIGRTVFQGTKLDEFRVHIIGVLRNVIGPRRNLILAKLEGGPLAQTGVIAGMSGSPVYIDGRLVGAVAYSLGQFSKEPIAGITPIAEMIETSTLARRPAPARARLQVPVTREALASALGEAFAAARPFASRSGDVQLLRGVAGSIDPQIGALMRPIATPLVMSGFEADLISSVVGAFSDNGFVPMFGGAGDGPAPEEPTGKLQPGDAVGVNLISGDLSLGATGTVTEVDGDRVYAFGHAFYNLGPTEFPMTRAYVYTLLPSLAASMKISSTGDVIGTFQQDRTSGISGTLGKGPATVPVRVTLDAARGLKKDFSFRVVNDQLFTPLATYVSILNTLGSYEREYGAATFSVKGKALVRKHGAIDFEDVFSGDSPSVGAASYIAAPINFLLGNDFEPIEIEALDLTISSTEERRTATLERVWLDAVLPRAGRTYPLNVLLRTHRGDEVTRTVPVAIPANATGALSILVSDGLRLGQLEQRELRQTLQLRGIPQMIRTLNNARKNNKLYVKLLSSDAGAVIQGEYLSSLPPSVLAVYEGDRNGGTFVPLRNATLGEWELTTEHAVSGTRTLTVDVQSRD
jgi:hypothetical protein